MKDLQELKGELYQKFGAYSNSALQILQCASVGTPDIHDLVKKTGYSFRLVKEILHNVGVSDVYANPLLSSELVSIVKGLTFKSIKQVTEQELSSTIGKFTKHNKNYDHVSATAETVLLRAQKLFNGHDIERCKILFLGDHDFTSLALAAVAKKNKLDYNFFVVDIDENVLEFIENAAKEHGYNITIARADFRYHLPISFSGKMDIVFTDPPYTPEGMGVFINRAIQSMKSDGFSTMYLCYKTAELSSMVGVAIQKELTNRCIYTQEIIANFNIYDAAEALGYRSDLYICRATPKTFQIVENSGYSYRIYTHGENAIESSKEQTPYNACEAIKESFGLEVGKLFFVEDWLISKRKNANNLAISFAKLIATRTGNTFNFPKDRTPVFDFTNSEIETRLLFLCNSDSFFCVTTKQQRRIFLSDTIIQLLSKYFVIEPNDKGQMTMYSFRKRSDLSKKLRLINAIFHNSSSSIRNAFVKAYTDIFECTQNQARKVFDDLDFDACKTLCSIDLPKFAIDRFLNKLIELEIV